MGVLPFCSSSPVAFIFFPAAAHNRNCDESFTHIFLPLLPLWLLLVSSDRGFMATCAIKCLIVSMNHIPKNNNNNILFLGKVMCVKALTKIQLTSLIIVRDFFSFTKLVSAWYWMKVRAIAQ